MDNGVQFYRLDDSREVVKCGVEEWIEWARSVRVKGVFGVIEQESFYDDGVKCLSLLLEVLPDMDKGLPKLRVLYFDDAGLATHDEYTDVGEAKRGFEDKKNELMGFDGMNIKMEI